jgi:hypothetical protein
MSNGANVNVTLEARIPNPAQFTGLLDQLATELGRVDIPGLPTAEIGRVVAGLDIALPDTSRWSAVVVPDAAALLRDFPNPADLAGPLLAPVERVKMFLDADFAGEIGRLQAALGTIAPPSPDTPQALLQGIFGPLEAITRLFQDSELTRLLIALGEVLGISEIRQLPTELGAFTARLQTLLQERISNPLLAIGAISAAGTLVARTEREVADALSWFGVADTETRWQALLAAYGNGEASLAAQLRALDIDDATQVAAMRERLHVATDAFATYHTRLLRDLAFSEASTLLIDPAALTAAFRAIGQTLAGVDQRLIGVLADSLQSLFQRLKDAFPFDGDMNLERFRQQIAHGIAEAKRAIDALDLSGITDVFQTFTETITAPFQRIEAFKVEVEALVRDAFGAVEDAVRQIDIGPIRAAFDQGLAQVEAQIGEVETLFRTVRETVEGALNQVKVALDGARTFILDPDTGLKAQIERVFGELFDLLDQLDIQGAVDQVNQVVQPIAVELGRIEFAPVIDATVSVIDTIVDVLGTVAPLLVTDDLKQKLAEATEFLRDIPIDQIITTLNQTFDEILDAVDEDALGQFKEEYNKVVRAIDQLDPAPALEALQQEVFDPLIAELERFDPADLLQPLQDAYDAAHGALSGFDPAETLRFITDFFDDLMAKVRELSPTQLLVPVEQALAEVRQTIMSTLRVDEILSLLDQMVAPVQALLAQVDLDPLFAAIAPGYAELQRAVADFDPARLAYPFTAALRGIFEGSGLDVDHAGVAGLLSAISTASGGLGARLSALPPSLHAHATAIGSLDLRPALLTLRTRHDELQSALALHTGPAVLELSVDVALLDPMPTLAPIATRLGRVQGAFGERATSLAELAAAVTPVLATADTLAQALGRLLSPLELLKEMLREPIRRLVPARADGSFADVLLALLEILNPATWQTEFQQVAQALRDKVQALFGDIVINPLRETLLSIKRLVDLLDISALRTAIQEVFDQVDATLRQFDPRPIIEAMDATYRRILGLYEQLDPASFIAEIDRLYSEDVIGVIRAISPTELLLPSLRELFDRIKELLVAFDVEAIFRPVLDQLRALQEQLRVGLERAGESFDRMIDTLDAAAGASVSVSVSVTTG